MAEMWDALMGSAQPPFRAGASYNTPLDPLNEIAFRQWASDNKVPFDPQARSSDYDMRGYWQGLMRGNPMARPTQIDPNDNRPHYTDYYKTPAHETFSSASQWAGPQTPSWVNDTQLAAPNGRVVFTDRPRPADDMAALLQKMRETR